MKTVIKQLFVSVSLLILPYTLSAQQITDNTAQKSESVAVQAPTVPISERCHDLRITYGVPGLIPSLMLYGSDSYGDTDLDEPYDPTLSDRIRDERSYWGQERMFAVINAEYTYALKPWFSLGGRVTFGGSFRTRRDIFTNEVIEHNDKYTGALLISMRFSYLRREVVQLYSGIAVGAAGHISNDTTYWAPMYDATYIGVSVGRKLFGIAEFGGGMSGLIRIGLGYRF